MMYIVQGVEEIPTKILHTFGVEQPESPGLCGGLPSCTNQFAILRSSNIRDLLASGRLPGSLSELDGKLEVFGAYAATSMRDGDVYSTASMGGGGYGDPLDRDPSRVAADVERLLVTPKWAARAYGVVLRDGVVDEAHTVLHREELRDERREAAGGALTHVRDSQHAAWNPAAAAARLSEAVSYELRNGDAVYRCRCGYELGPADRPYTELAAIARFPVQRIGPRVNPNRVGGTRFELREICCPACFTLLGAEIARPDDPILADASVTIEAVRAASVMPPVTMGA
jgi:N-methylhydantoinase B